MRPGGLGSTQLIQKLAQLAWYWWPPYSSLKLSVSELNACSGERVKKLRDLDLTEAAHTRGGIRDMKEVTCLMITEMKRLCEITSNCLYNGVRTDDSR